MKLACACNCIYCSDVANVSLYADAYLKYVAYFAEGSYLHLVVVIAEKNGCVVSACAECFGKIVDRLSMLPEYPENIDCICNCFFYCCTSIWSLFLGMKALKKCSRRIVIGYLHCSCYSQDVCNNCMKCFLIYLKGFFMPYLIDDTEKFCIEFEKMFGQYKSKQMKRYQRFLSGNKTMMSSPYSNFLYEISLYLKIHVSELKKLFGNHCEYLYSLCDKVYKCFRRRFRKNCRKSG